MAQARKKGTSKRGRPVGSKNRASKKSAPAHELPGGFWRQIVAILLALFAVFMVLTWMGNGGEILNTVDATLESWIGGARYLIPLLLFWMAYKIFQNENNQLAPVVWIASILLLVWVAGAFGLTSIDDAAVSNGGAVGDWLNQFMTDILSSGTAILIYVILIFITTAFIMQLTPAAVIESITNMFRTKEVDKVKKPARVAKESAKPEKKVKHVGDDDIDVEVPEAEPELKAAPKLSMFAKLTGKKNKEENEQTEDTQPVVDANPMKEKKSSEPALALVAASDPDWKKPDLNLLEKETTKPNAGDKHQIMETIRSTLAEFGIDVEMVGANVGPRVTQYTMRPPAGVNLSKISARDKELAMNLAVSKVRIEAPIPGTKLVGIELPNAVREDVRLRSILESQEWKNARGPLTFAVGKDISGKPIVGDLVDMRHLLIAGTTGSGKSVMTNTLLSSLLYRNSPSDLKLIIVDPKQVEMAQYEDIPHLLTPVINSPDKALSAFRWVVDEMEKRYSLMAKERVKNIQEYNEKMAEMAAAQEKAEKKTDKAEAVEEPKKIEVEGAETEKKPETVAEEQTQAGERMPYIVVLVDEMADLMMTAGKDLEMPIVRVAQKGRAAGIHLVLATQRPTVKVVTGLIKANVPSMIAFAVLNQVDSHVILGMSGAEKLLGEGDMLMFTIGMNRPARVQGAFISTKDGKNLTDFLRKQRAPQYNAEVVSQPVQIKGMSIGGDDGIGRRFDPNDPIVRKAIEVTLRNGKFSTASLQTWLGKGHGFVSGLAIWLEEIGVIGPAQGHKPRDVLISSMEEFEEKAGVS